MKKLALLAGLVLVLTTLTSALEVTEINFDPANPETGEQVEVTAIAEGDDLEYIEARLPEQSEFESRNCGIGPCDNEDDPWYFTPGSSGSYTVEVRAGTVFEQSEVLEETIQVDSTDSEMPITVNSVSATRFDISEGQSTQLQAEVANSDSTYPRSVNVKWYADDGNYRILLDEDEETIQEDSEETIVSGFLSWNELRDKGIDLEEDYDLTAEVSVDGETLSASADQNLVLRGSAEFDVEIRDTSSPVDKGETLQVEYRIQNIGNTYGSQYVNLSIDGDKVDSYGRVGLSDGYDDTGTLEWDTSNADSGTYTATVATDDDSASTQVTVDEVITSTCDLDVGEVTLNPSTVDEGESIEAELSVSNEGDTQDVKITFSGGGDTFTTSRVTLVSGEEREFSGALSPSFSDQVEVEVETINGPCGDDVFATRSDDVTVVDQSDDEGPEAGFSFDPANPEVGETVEFDASDSSGDIESYEWGFGDGNSRDGELVENTYDAAGEYPVSLTVTDEQGRTDTEIRDLVVSPEPAQCGISRSNIGFSLQDYVIEEGENTEAEVVVNNDISQDQNVRVEFTVGGRTVDTVESTVSGNDYREFSQEVSADGDSFVRAHVETEGSPCGDQRFSFSKELYVISQTDEDAYLNVDVEDEEGDAIRGAKVEVEGPEDRIRYTDNYGRKGFSLEPGDYDVEVSRLGYETKEKSIELQSGDNRDLRFELERTQEDNGVLEVNVEDEDGDWIEDARVEVENGEDRYDLTNSNGFTAFSLHPDRYDVEVSHPDYEETVTDSVRIYEDEVERRTYRLGDEDRDGIQISSTSYDDTVCRGGTLAVEVSVENRDNIDEFVTVTGNGLGSNIVLDSFILDEGETEERRIRFTNVEGDGTETFTIRARNGTSDRVTRSVDVEDCVPTGTPTQDPSSVSMKLSYPISPNKALVGDTVKVSGFVDGVNRRANVEIDVNGDRKARVSTQPDGYYQTYIRADSVGMKTVRARSGGQSASRELQVLPTANVGMIDAPDRAFEGESFGLCTQVQSQVNARVLLLEDGELIESTNDRGEVCFEVDAEQPGNHIYEVRAITAGQSSSSKTTVEVLETDVEVRSFPDQIASVESGSGMVKVDLYNTKNELTRYNLELEGLPSTWLSQSEKQVVLNPGERREVFFYLTPRDEGTYDPEVIVEARNQEVFRQTVDLETGGQNRPRKKSFVQKLRGFFTL